MTGPVPEEGDDGSVDRRSLRRLLAMCGVAGLVVLLVAAVAAGLAMTSLDRYRIQLVDRLDPAGPDVVEAVRGRTVLLVVDASSSLWPVTVASAVLRRAGATAVLPLLLHRRP